MLVKCEICHGTGKVRCECSLAHDSGYCRPNQDGKAGACSEAIAESADAIAESADAPLDNKNAVAVNAECSECGGSGSVMCLGCMGTGYVDMPCFA